MRLRFICSRIRPGSCGVGDYTRRLAAAMVRRGISVEIVATHDPEISLSQNFFLQEEEIQIPCLRIALRDSTARREVLGDQIPHEEEGEIWSFQFSGFQAYHPKGWPHVFRQQIGRYLEGKRLHIMCHEIWFDPKASSWKRRILGSLQQRELRHFLQRTSPFLVHTHTPYYHFQLRSFGVETSFLQLFGNIPHFSANNNAFLQQENQEPKRDEQQTVWTAAVFGTIHPTWDPHPFLDSILPLLESRKIRLVLAFIGRNGSYFSAYIKCLKNTYQDRLTVVFLGEQSAEKIAEFFRTLQFGISTNGWGLNAKSGTVAALLDFGIPVVVTQDSPYALYGEMERKGLVRHWGSFFEDLEKARVALAMQQRKQLPFLEVVADQFLGDLRRALAMGKKE